ncbi:MAG: DUF2961 domain-containing protein [Chitinivibrionales bacterium]|nr:DUF2961 domain-containing protein [Chitinivibrionales bacterium]
MLGFISGLSRFRNTRARRVASWDPSGGNHDFYEIGDGETRVLADIKGPGRITHIWMTQQAFFRETLLRITWDNADQPSVLCPLGDFFGLGNNIINSYESLLFCVSTDNNNRMTNQAEAFSFAHGAALNCYIPMPFRERALIEVINEGTAKGPGRYFYVDYEELDGVPDDEGYFHAEWRRLNPFPGWYHSPKDGPEAVEVPNVERTAWDNNYVILDTKGRGHYIGCNLSVANFFGGWWGEGDDMIWVDGYKWPPDIHGTGSEDYLCHAWGMQRNAFLRCGTSIHEGDANGYQTSYVHHIENPVPFTKEIKVTIESGHANHMANDICSTAYWYADKPYAACAVPPMPQRLPVLRDNHGEWIDDPAKHTGSHTLRLTDEMKRAREKAGD